jgi:hypothetical protein
MLDRVEEVKLKPDVVRWLPIGAAGCILSMPAPGFAARRGCGLILPSMSQFLPLFKCEWGARAIHRALRGPLASSRDDQTPRDARAAYHPLDPIRSWQ